MAPHHKESFPRLRPERIDPKRIDDMLWNHLRELESGFLSGDRVGPHAVGFACHDRALVVECGVRFDYRRHADLEAHGYRLVWLSSSEIGEHPDHCLRYLTDALRGEC